MIGRSLIWVLDFLFELGMQYQSSCGKPEWKTLQYHYEELY